MKAAVQEALVTINRRFYTARAHEFSQTRGKAWPGFDGLLPLVEEDARVLDLGCGNGRLLEFLKSHRNLAGYVGIDSSPELLSIARDTVVRRGFANADFDCGDLTTDEWAKDLAEKSFGIVILIAVLQHVPGIDSRQRLIERAATLVKDGGVVALANWQFMNSERLRSKIADWSMVGIDRNDVDPGDYLLEWRSGGLAHRYCHMIELDEMRTLASGVGMHVAESYTADGHDGDQNLYTILRRRYA